MTPARPAQPAGPAVLLVVAAGGALGATLRHLLTLARPGDTAPTVLAINVIGCALMGALTVVVARGTHPLVKPFLGTGVLGGFTTVSTYALLVHGLAARGSLAAAAGYLVVTPVLAVAAAGVGTRLAGRVGGRS